MKLEPKGTIDFILNDRTYVVKVFNNNCSIYPFKGFIYDDTNTCLGKTIQGNIAAIKKTAIEIVQQDA